MEILVLGPQKHYVTPPTPLRTGQQRGIKMNPFMRFQIAYLISSDIVQGE